MGKEKGQSALQYLMVIGIGSMMIVIVVFMLLNPFQSARKKAERYTTKAACQIQTGIDEYSGGEEYNGTWITAPKKLIDESGNKTFNKTSEENSEYNLPIKDNSPGDCPYNSTLKGSCKLNGYNLSLVNHPCGQKALYLNQDDTWINYTRIK